MGTSDLETGAAFLTFDLPQAWKWTMWQIVQLVILGILAVVFGLSGLSRRFPHVGWLQPFRFNWPQLSAEHRERMRRRANVHAGIELILLGFVVPIVYVGSSIMMFNDPTALGLTISMAIAALLIALGITAVWRNARRHTDNDLQNQSAGDTQPPSRQDRT